LGGSAVNGTDYQSLTNSVTILAGENTAQVVVAPIDDLQADPGENVVLTITPSSGYDITGATASLFIDDNEPTISVTATTDTVVEGAGSGVFTLRRSLGDISNALAVNYTITGTATNGTDYTTLTGTANFAAGVDEITVNVATIDNAVFEGAETVTLTIDNSTSYIVSTLDPSDTVTITDANDQLLETVRITADPTSVAEDETNPARRSIFTITRDDANGFANNLTVLYTISGSAQIGVDYNTITDSVTIAAGSAFATIEIAPLDDFDGADRNDPVPLTLRDPVTGPPAYVFGTSVTSTITITDDDDPLGLPQVTVIASPDTALEATVLVDDPNSNDPDQLISVRQRASFTFNRSSTLNDNLPLTVNFTIGGTATVGGDYENSMGTSIIFAASDLTNTIELTAIDDLIYDPD